MYFSQKPKIIQNCDDYNFKKMNLGPRTFKEAKKRKKSKNKRCSKPKTKIQVVVSNGTCSTLSNSCLSLQQSIHARIL